MNYSPSKNSFYPSEFKQVYLDAGAWPDDAGTISREEYDLLMQGQSEGKVIAADENGYPVLQDVPPIPADVLLSSAKDELRTMRRDMLDAVTGIGFRASVAGNAALAQEAAQVSQQLLDITDDPALNAAQTYDDMRAAGMAAYRLIANSVSADLRSAFNEL